MSGLETFMQAPNATIEVADDFDEINRLFRATKLLEIGAGTTEVRKMIISGELLKS